MYSLEYRRWRQDWNQGDFPFYWVQLADSKMMLLPRRLLPGRLREASLGYEVLNTGQAVITDLGEATTSIPRTSRTSPNGSPAGRLPKTTATISFKSSVQSLTAQRCCPAPSMLAKTTPLCRSTRFTLTNDEAFHPAKAKIVGKDRIEVWSDAVPNPIAARYAWADNPVCTSNREGLPLTPFRTDEPRWSMDGHSLL